MQSNLWLLRLWLRIFCRKFFVFRHFSIKAKSDFVRHQIFNFSFSIFIFSLFALYLEQIFSIFSRNFQKKFAFFAKIDNNCFVNKKMISKRFAQFWKLFVINMKNIKTKIINTIKQIDDLIDWFILRHSSFESYQSIMYIDFENVNFCRENSIFILIFLIDINISIIRVCFINIYFLNSQTFNIIDIKKKILKNIFQDEKIFKIFFDVRNDSNVLFAHFDITLQKMKNMQFMKSVSKKITNFKKYMNDLIKCIEQNVLYDNDLTNWKQTKKNETRLFKFEFDDFYKIFKQRSIFNEIIFYCIDDVQYFSELWNKFR